MTPADACGSRRSATVSGTPASTFMLLPSTLGPSGLRIGSWGMTSTGPPLSLWSSASRMPTESHTAGRIGMTSVAWILLRSPGLTSRLGHVDAPGLRAGRRGQADAVGDGLGQLFVSEQPQPPARAPAPDRRSTSAVCAGSTRRKPTAAFRRGMSGGACTRSRCPYSTSTGSPITPTCWWARHPATATTWTLVR